MRNFKTIYGTNDDAFMASVLSGDYTGSVNYHLIFIKTALTIPLSIIQKSIPNINVYTYTLFFILSFAYGSLLFLLRYVNDKLLRNTFYLYFLIGYILFIPWAFLSPTYTNTAIFAGAAGVTLLFSSIIYERKAINYISLAAVILISLSVAIRFESFLLTLLILSPIFLIKIFYSKLFLSKNFLISTTLVMLMIILILTFEKLNYRSPEWKQYSEINTLRHSIQLRTAEYALKDNLQNMNWSDYDYEMFIRFSLTDENKLNASNLQQARDNTASFRGIRGILNTKPLNEFYFIKNSFLNFQFIYEILILIMLSAFFILNLRRFAFNLILLALISSSALYVLASNYHLPERITFGFLFILFIGIIVNLILVSSESWKRQNIRLSLTVVTLFVLFSLMLQELPEQLSARSTYHEKLHMIRDSQSSFFEAKKNLIFIGNGSKIRESWQDPYQRFLPISSENNILLLGWHVNSPLWKEKYKNFKFTNSDFYLEFKKNSNLRWVESPESKDLLQDFLEQYLENEVFLEESLFAVDNDYASFKIKR